ncbi:MAG: tetratricopeptide repeat protein [Nannocystaceae bacterium]
MLSILRRQPRNYVATYCAAWLYYRQGRYEDAVTFYHKARAIAPRALEPKLGLLATHIAAQNWKDVESVGMVLLKEVPSDYITRSRLAFV